MGIASPSAVEGHQILPGKRIEVFLAEPPGHRDGDPDLPKMFGAVVTFAWVRLQARPIVPVEAALQVLRQQGHGLTAGDVMAARTAPANSHSSASDSS